MIGRAQTQRIDDLIERLEGMRRARIWPDGLRYLWTDAFGLVLLVSLARATGEQRFAVEAERLVRDVERVLGRPRGLRIGEAPDRSGQYYHYLAMWVFALTRLDRLVPGYRDRALELVRGVHPRFVVEGLGVHWKMREDLSGPWPGFGFGALDPFDGYVAYRLLGESELRREIAEMHALVLKSHRRLWITQDLGLGMMLWLSHFFPDEEWARLQKRRSLEVLDSMWIEPQGYFCREPQSPAVRFAFTNHGVSIGLQAVGAMPARVERLRRYFRHYRSGDAYDTDAITHVMACCAEFPGEFVRENWVEHRNA